MRKSWNDVFEKQASKIDLKKVPEWSKLLKEEPRCREDWNKFLKESITEIPTLVLISYLQDLFNKILSNTSENFQQKTPLVAFARTGNSKIVDFILHTENFPVGFAERHEALYFAANYGHVNVAKLLKQRRFRNFSAILCASQSGHLEVLKVLIDDDPKAMNLDHHIIWTAAYSGKFEVLEYFERLNKDWFEEALLKQCSQLWPCHGKCGHIQF